MERGAWRATVHGVAKNQVQLSDFTFFLYTHIYVCVYIYIYIYIYTGSPASQADSLPSELPTNRPP